MTLSLAQLKKTYGVGLTGGIATGKSTVAKMIAADGFLVIDADVLAREVVRPGTTGLAAIVSHFGDGILAKDGTLARAELGKRIFGDAASRTQLEKILHPRIQTRLGEVLEGAHYFAKPKPFFYEAALLVESGHFASFREYWCTLCLRETQITRLMLRNQRSREDAEQMIAAQMPAAEKAAGASVVIQTEGSLAAVEIAVKHALALLAKG